MYNKINIYITSFGGGVGALGVGSLGVGSRGVGTLGVGSLGVGFSKKYNSIIIVVSKIVFNFQ